LAYDETVVARMRDSAIEAFADPAIRRFHAHFPLSSSSGDEMPPIATDLYPIGAAS